MSPIDAPPTDSRPKDDDFYVGYLPTAPRSVAMFVTASVLCILAISFGVGFLMASLQAPFDPGSFEFGKPQKVEGALYEHPYPVLVRPHLSGEDSPAPPVLLLTGAGKHGAAFEPSEGPEGRAVRVDGSLVLCEDRMLLSLENRNGNLVVARSTGDEPGGRRTMERLRSVSLTGEIVDSKCYLGVMKPGRGKTHRGCAARCLSGGIPPLLLIETDAGERASYLLLDERGEPLPRELLLEWVGQPVAIDGTLARQDDALLLLADETSFRKPSD